MGELYGERVREMEIKLSWMQPFASLAMLPPRFIGQISLGEITTALAPVINTVVTAIKGSVPMLDATNNLRRHGAGARKNHP